MLDICSNYSGPRSRVELALKGVKEEEAASTRSHAERAGKTALRHPCLEAPAPVTPQHGSEEKKGG